MSCYVGLDWVISGKLRIVQVMSVYIMIYRVTLGYIILGQVRSG